LETDTPGLRGILSMSIRLISDTHCGRVYVDVGGDANVRLRRNLSGPKIILCNTAIVSLTDPDCFIKMANMLEECFSRFDAFKAAGERCRDCKYGL
jgi:hypothetical protein